MTAPLIRRWVSSSVRGQFGLEFTRANADDLRQTLGRNRKAAYAQPAFVLLHCERMSHSRVRELVVAARSNFADSRICLSWDAVSDVRDDPKDFGAGEVGLLLDKVDADTPLARVAAPFIEAIRFDDAFATYAAGNVRASCVFTAMFGLARDLGLCTLGPRMSPASEHLGVQSDFDFVPERPTAARPAIARSAGAIVRHTRLGNSRSFVY